MAGPDILAALVPNTKAKAGDLNDKFDSIKAWGSAIPLDDLADGTSGQIIVCNGSGVPVYVSPAGAVGVSTAGATTITQTELDQTGTTTLPIDGTTYTTLTNCSVVPAAGTWLVLAKLRITSTANYQAKARLAYGVVAVDSALADVVIGVGGECSLPLMAKITADGSSTLAIQAVTTSLSGSPSASYGRLVLIRVA